MNIQKKQTFRDIYRQNKSKKNDLIQDFSEYDDDLSNYPVISDDTEIQTSKVLEPEIYKEPEYLKSLAKKDAKYFVEDEEITERVSNNTGNALNFKQHFQEMNDLIERLQPLEDKKRDNPFNITPCFNLKEVMLMGRVATPPEEMAGFFMCEVATINRELKNRESPFAIVYNKAAAQIKATLRGTQIDMALSGSEPMLKWVGTNLLNQADKTEHIRYTEELSDEELQQKLDLLEQSIKRISNG